MAIVENLDTNPYYYNNTVPSEKDDSNNVYTELYAVPSDSGNDYTPMDRNNRNNADNVNLPSAKCDAHTRDVIYFNRSTVYIVIAVAVAAMLIVSICAGILGYNIRKCEHSSSEFEHQRDESRPAPTDDHVITSVTDITSIKKDTTSPNNNTPDKTTTKTSTTAVTTQRIDEATVSVSPTYFRGKRFLVITNGMKKHWHYDLSYTKIVSGLWQPMDSFVKFKFDLQSDGSYKIKSIGGNVYMFDGYGVPGSHSPYLNGIDKTDDDHMRFLITKNTGNHYRIKTKATGRYVRMDPDLRVSTRYNIMDDNSLFSLEKL